MNTADFAAGEARVKGGAAAMTRTVETQTTRMGAAFTRLGATTLRFAGFAGIGALYLAIKGGSEIIKENNEALAQASSAIKTTGGVAHVTTRHVEDLANRWQKLTGQHAGVIASTEAMLLRFNRVRNEMGAGNKIFDRTVTAIMNINSAMHKGLQPTTVALGKAIQDPAKYLGMLARSGITFTAQQTKMIKTLEASKGVLAAQKYVLSSLEERYNGAAKAAGKTLTGQLNIAKIALLDNVAVVLKSLIPSFIILTKVLGVVAGFFARHQALAKLLIFGFLSLAAAAATYTIALKLASAATLVWTGVTKLATAAWWLFNAAIDANPIVLITAAIVALGFGLYELYKHFDVVRSAVNKFASAIKGALGSVLGWVRSHWKEIATLIAGPFAPLVLLATGAFGVRAALLGALKSMARTVEHLAENIGHAIWEGIKRGAGNIASEAKSWLLDPLKSAFGEVKHFFGISSPSRWTREVIGRPLAQGVRLGYEKEMGEFLPHKTVRKALTPSLGGSAATAAVSASPMRRATHVGGSRSDAYLLLSKLPAEQLEARAGFRAPKGQLVASIIEREGFATGGVVKGRKGRDKIPAYLTEGEVVLNREQQRRTLDRMGLRGDAHTLFRAARGFAGGGVVGSKGYDITQQRSGGTVNLTANEVRVYAGYLTQARTQQAGDSFHHDRPEPSTSPAGLAREAREAQRRKHEQDVLNKKSGDVGFSQTHKIDVAQREVDSAKEGTARWRRAMSDYIDAETAAIKDLRDRYNRAKNPTTRARLYRAISDELKNRRDAQEKLKKESKSSKPDVSWMTQQGLASAQRGIDMATVGSKAWEKAMRAYITAEGQAIAQLQALYNKTKSPARRRELYDQISTEMKNRKDAQDQLAEQSKKSKPDVSWMTQQGLASAQRGIDMATVGSKAWEKAMRAYITAEGQAIAQLQALYNKTRSPEKRAELYDQISSDLKSKRDAEQQLADSADASRRLPLQHAVDVAQRGIDLSDEGTKRWKTSMRKYIKAETATIAELQREWRNAKTPEKRAELYREITTELKARRDARKQLKDATAADATENTNFAVGRATFFSEFAPNIFTKTDKGLVPGSRRARKYALGGAVPGRGTQDTVPAMLTPGEVVLNRDHQQGLSRRLGMPGAGPHTLFRAIQHFKTGGVAGRGEAKTPFADLPDDEKRRRIIAGWQAGRMSFAQAKSAMRFWHLPFGKGHVDRSHATAEPDHGEHRTSIPISRRERLHFNVTGRSSGHASPEQSKWMKTWLHQTQGVGANLRDVGGMYKRDLQPMVDPRAWFQFGKFAVQHPRQFAKAQYEWYRHPVRSLQQHPAMFLLSLLPAGKIAALSRTGRGLAAGEIGAADIAASLRARPSVRAAMGLGRGARRATSSVALRKALGLLAGERGSARVDVASLGLGRLLARRRVGGALGPRTTAVDLALEMSRSMGDKTEGRTDEILDMAHTIERSLHRREGRALARDAYTFPESYGLGHLLHERRPLPYSVLPGHEIEMLDPVGRGVMASRYARVRGQHYVVKSGISQRDIASEILGSLLYRKAGLQAVSNSLVKLGGHVMPISDRGNLGMASHVRPGGFTAIYQQRGLHGEPFDITSDIHNLGPGQLTALHLKRYSRGRVMDQILGYGDMHLGNIMWDRRGHPRRLDFASTLLGRHALGLGGDPYLEGGYDPLGAPELTWRQRHEQARHIARVLNPHQIDYLVNASPFSADDKALVAARLKERIAYALRTTESKTFHERTAARNARAARAASAAKSLTARRAGQRLVGGPKTFTRDEMHEMFDDGAMGTVGHDAQVEMIRDVRRDIFGGANKSTRDRLRSELRGANRRLTSFLGMGKNTREQGGFATSVPRASDSANTKLIDALDLPISALTRAERPGAVSLRTRHDVYRLADRFPGASKFLRREAVREERKRRQHIREGQMRFENVLRGGGDAAERYGSRNTERAAKRPGTPFFTRDLVQLRGLFSSARTESLTALAKNLAKILRDERGSANVDYASLGAGRAADSVLAQRIRMGLISRDKSWLRPVKSDYKGPPPPRSRMRKVWDLLRNERGGYDPNAERWPGAWDARNMSRMKDASVWESLGGKSWEQLNRERMAGDPFSFMDEKRPGRTRRVLRALRSERGSSNVDFMSLGLGRLMSRRFGRGTYIPRPRPSMTLREAYEAWSDRENELHGVFLPRHDALVTAPMDWSLEDIISGTRRHMGGAPLGEVIAARHGVGRWKLDYHPHDVPRRMYDRLQSLINSPVVHSDLGVMKRQRAEVTDAELKVALHETREGIGRHTTHVRNRGAIGRYGLIPRDTELHNWPAVAGMGNAGKAVYVAQDPYSLGFGPLRTSLRDVGAYQIDHRGLRSELDHVLDDGSRRILEPVSPRRLSWLGTHEWLTDVKQGFIPPAARGDKIRAKLWNRLRAVDYGSERGSASLDLATLGLGRLLKRGHTEFDDLGPHATAYTPHFSVLDRMLGRDRHGDRPLPGTMRDARLAMRSSSRALKQAGRYDFIDPEDVLHQSLMRLHSAGPSVASVLRKARSLNRRAARFLGDERGSSNPDFMTFGLGRLLRKKYDVREHASPISDDYVRQLRAESQDWGMGGKRSFGALKPRRVRGTSTGMMAADAIQHNADYGAYLREYRTKKGELHGLLSYDDYGGGKDREFLKVGYAAAKYGGLDIFHDFLRHAAGKKTGIEFGTTPSSERLYRSLGATMASPFRAALSPRSVRIAARDLLAAKRLRKEKGYREGLPLSSKDEHDLEVRTRREAQAQRRTALTDPIQKYLGFFHEARGYGETPYQAGRRAFSTGTHTKGEHGFVLGAHPTPLEARGINAYVSARYKVVPDHTGFRAFKERTGEVSPWFKTHEEAAAWATKMNATRAQRAFSLGLLRSSREHYVPRELPELGAGIGGQLHDKVAKYLDFWRTRKAMELRPHKEAWEKLGFEPDPLTRERAHNLELGRRFPGLKTRVDLATGAGGLSALSYVKEIMERGGTSRRLAPGGLYQDAESKANLKTIIAHAERVAYPQPGAMQYGRKMQRPRNSMDDWRSLHKLFPDMKTTGILRSGPPGEIMDYLAQHAFGGGSISPQFRRAMNLARDSDMRLSPAWLKMIMGRKYEIPPGMVEGFSLGGVVKGARAGDRVPAMLERGEIVFNKQHQHNLAAGLGVTYRGPEDLFRRVQQLALGSEETGSPTSAGQQPPNEMHYHQNNTFHEIPRDRHKLARQMRESAMAELA